MKKQRQQRGRESHEDAITLPGEVGRGTHLWERIERKGDLPFRVEKPRKKT